MPSLRELQKNWEGFAQADPLWAICTDPQKRNQKWSEQDFVESGNREIEKVLSHVRFLGLPVDPKGPALDFGCGVGRLTQALAMHFDECWGVDISPTMIRTAQNFHKTNPRCNFWLNQTDNLQKFPDRSFAFIYSSIVLQHIVNKYVRSYLQEFIRILKPGGILVFQIPDRNLTGIPTRIWRRWGGRGRGDILSKPGGPQFRMRMHCLREREVRGILAKHLADVVDVQLTNSTETAFNGNLRYLEHEPRSGFVSKQYCVLKRT
ncbi:MAG: class I SAM-dependent methyltransferase [Terriglobales bacterium]